MMQAINSLQLHVAYMQPMVCDIVINIPASFVDAIYHETVIGQKKNTTAYGFQKGSIPEGYVEQTYKANIMEHLQEFLFKYCVMSFLYKEIRNQKLAVAGEPRLESIELEPHQDAKFHFSCSLFPAIALNNWKLFSFKAPKRKNYKDLDRQVEGFIKDERDAAKTSTPDVINIGDWICFNLFLVDDKHKSVVDEYKETVWLKIGDEEADEEFQTLFVGKKIGDTFYTSNECLQEYFSTNFPSKYQIGITIKDVLCTKFFDFELFKKHFRMKSNKEMVQKLIEVFSYRNDLSQRRSTIEDTFKLLLTKHKFEAPNHVVLRQQSVVLAAVQENPDYHVYRMQPDFKERIRQLAEKQVQEIMILTQIAYHEGIEVNDEDIKSYLNFIQRHRMKDFLYFDMPETRVGGQEMPISAEVLKQTCLLEKTLNYIIYYLTKK